MSKVLQRGTVLLAVVAGLMLAAAQIGTAQTPTSPWKKAAPFPEPDEELYGVAVNGNRTSRVIFQVKCRGPGPP